MRTMVTTVLVVGDGGSGKEEERRRRTIATATSGGEEGEDIFCVNYLLFLKFNFSLRLYLSLYIEID